MRKLLVIALTLLACDGSGPTIDLKPDSGDVSVKALTADELAHVGEVLYFWPTATHITNNQPRLFFVQSWDDGDPVMVEGRAVYGTPTGDQTYGNPEDDPILDPPSVGALELADAPEVGKLSRPAPIIGRARVAFAGLDTVSVTTSWQDFDQGTASGDESSAIYSSPTLTISTAGTWQVSLSTGWQRESLVTTAVVTAAVWVEGAQTDLTMSCFLPILDGGAGCTTATTGPLVLADGDEIVARFQGDGSFSADLTGYVLSATRVSN